MAQSNVLRIYLVICCLGLLLQFKAQEDDYPNFATDSNSNLLIKTPQGSSVLVNEIDILNKISKLEQELSSIKKETETMKSVLNTTQDLISELLSEPVLPSVFRDSNMITTIVGAGSGPEWNGETVKATETNIAFAYVHVLTNDCLLLAAAYDQNRIGKYCEIDKMLRLVAGNGTKGFGGDGGDARDAALNQPHSIATNLDQSVIYFCDRGNNRVRKVNVNSNIIQTFAGNGDLGSSGDGGFATNAAVEGPTGIAVDADGNVYIASGVPRCVVRKVDATTNIITRIAGRSSRCEYSGDGNLAHLAAIHSPHDIVLWSNFTKLLIPEWGSSVIRALDLKTTIIDTLIHHTTESDLSKPVSAAFDEKNQILYVSDHGHDRIRKFDFKSSMTSTLAGTGNSKFVSDLIPAKQANLDSPTGIRLDSQGNIIICSRDQRRVRKIFM